MTVMASISIHFGYGRHLGDISLPNLTQALFVRGASLSFISLLTFKVVLSGTGLLQMRHMANEALDSLDVPARIRRHARRSCVWCQIPDATTDHDVRSCRDLCLYLHRGYLCLPAIALQLE